MTHGHRACHPAVAKLLVLLALGLVPVSAWAEVLTFRNDTGSPILVQGASVVQGNVQRDQPSLVQPNETCKINLPGNKLITLYNPRMPNQVLFQTTIPAGAEDGYFSVQIDKMRGKVSIEKTKPPPRK